MTNDQKDHHVIKRTVSREPVIERVTFRVGDGPQPPDRQAQATVTMRDGQPVEIQLVEAGGGFERSREMALRPHEVRNVLEVLQAAADAYFYQPAPDVQSRALPDAMQVCEAIDSGFSLSEQTDAVMALLGGEGRYLPAREQVVAMLAKYRQIDAMTREDLASSFLRLLGIGDHGPA